MAAARAALEANSVALGAHHPPTSAHAAVAAFPRTGTHRRLALDAIARAAEGLTDDELLAAVPELGPNGVRARRGSLVDDGFIVDAGTTRPSPRTGLPCTVWTVAAATLELLELR